MFAENEEELKLVQQAIHSTNGLFFRIHEMPMARKVRLISAFYTTLEIPPFQDALHWK